MKNTVYYCDVCGKFFNDKMPLDHKCCVGFLKEYDCFFADTNKNKKVNNDTMNSNSTVDNKRCDKQSVSDNVNHPKHYQGANECIDVIKAMLTPEEYRGFLKGNSIKYRFRCGRKDGNPSEQDTKKAEYYETKLIESLK